MRRSNVFDTTRAYLRADPRRMDGIMVEYGRQWRSRTLPATTFTLFWIEGTQEFYAQDLISFQVYLLDRTAKTKFEAEKLLGPLKNKMTTGRLEDIFPELAEIAGPDKPRTAPPLKAPQFDAEASPSHVNKKAESKPDPYAKWHRRAPVASGGDPCPVTNPDDDLPF